MKKTLKRTIIAAAVTVPLISGVAIGSDVGATKQQADAKMDTTQARKTTDTASMKKDEMSCGQQFAAEAPMWEKRAELMTSVADTYAAHAEWIGSAPAAAKERAALMQISTAMRDMSKKAKSLAALMEKQKDLKDAPHDMSKTAAINKVADMEMKTAQLQREVAEDLSKAADQMTAGAQKMQSQTATGGSGPDQSVEPMKQPSDDSQMKDDQNAWPPMPENRQP